MNTTKFFKMYKEAESRAIVVPRGLSFLETDRVELHEARLAMKLQVSQIADILSDHFKDGYSVHWNRFSLWNRQINKCQILVAQPATATEQKSAVTVTGMFDGRIKSKADIQPAFNRAARQLVNLGITNSDEVTRYMNVAFATVRVEKKIDAKAERILNELRIDMDPTMSRLVLDRVKSQL